MGVHPGAKGFQERFEILGSLGAEAPVTGTVIDAFGLLEEIIGVLVGDPSGDKRWDHLVPRLERKPSPVIPIRLPELL